MNDYHEGSVVFKSAKGYGFITSEKLEANAFFHAINLKGIPFASLNIGQKVTFKITNNDRGIELVDVKPI